LSKQQGEEGSERGLILNLLCDHLLLQHPEQSIRLKNKQTKKQTIRAARWLRH
jgi:hypothetical protein